MVRILATAVPGTDIPVATNMVHYTVIVGVALILFMVTANFGKNAERFGGWYIIAFVLFCFDAIFFGIAASNLYGG